MTAPYTFPVTASQDRGAVDPDPDVVAEMYDALGYVVRELGIAHDTLTSVIAGTAIEHLAGAILDVTQRVDHVYAVAADLRRRYS